MGCYVPAVEKKVWKDGQWEFVGIEPNGSRANQCEQIEQFLLLDSPGPLVLCVEGVWGIGKSSLIMYAMAQLPANEQFRHVINISGAECMIWCEANETECSSNSLFPHQVIDYLNKHSQENVLMVIRDRNDREKWLPYLEILREHALNYVGLRVVIELCTNSEDVESRLTDLFGIFSGSPVRVDALSAKAPNDEIQYLLSNNGNQALTPGELKQIRRWCGRHPYALQVIRYALARCMNTDRNSLNDAGILRALDLEISQGAAKTFRDFAADFTQNIYGELEQEIELFRTATEHPCLDSVCGKLRRAGLLCRSDDGAGLSLIVLLHNKQLPPPLPPYYPIELRALLELVYWYWLMEYSPEAVRNYCQSSLRDLFTQVIGMANIRRWFGDPPLTTNRQLDMNQPIHDQKLYEAYRRMEHDQEWAPVRFWGEIREWLIKRLRERSDYTLEMLEIYWFDYTAQMSDWNSLKSATRLSVATVVVDGAKLKQTLDRLIVAMRQPL